MNIANQKYGNLKMAELLSSVGAVVLGMGLGLLFFRHHSRERASGGARSPRVRRTDCDAHWRQSQDGGGGGAPTGNGSSDR
jgi:hypothetical protein